MNKPKVTYILGDYPTHSHTYEKNEIEALRDDYEIEIIALTEAPKAYRNHLPFQVIAEPEAIAEAIVDSNPHVLHTHFLTFTPLIHRVSNLTGIPFTVRSHSFDVLRRLPRPGNDAWGSEPNEEMRLRRWLDALNDDACLGVLAFPFAVPWLINAGVKPEKLRECYPVVCVDRFYNEGENAPGVMNVGACNPKKNMLDFVELAGGVPERGFTLYPIVYDTTEIDERNRALGKPVSIHAPVEPEDMPTEYKKHTWLVYTASREIGTVGWPMSVAESQASGVGVCMPNLRPDLREYVGPSGFLYETVSDIKDIVAGPFPEDMRAQGFELAHRSNVAEHIHVLTDLWPNSHPISKA